MGVYAKQGSIVEIDEGLVYESRQGCEKYTALVVWNGYGNQPLLTTPYRWKPYWGTYESISRILETVDMDRMVRSYVLAFDEDGVIDNGI